MKVGLIEMEFLREKQHLFDPVHASRINLFKDVTSLNKLCH